MTEADTLKGDSLISQQYLEVSWGLLFWRAEMTEPIPNDNPMVQVAELLDYAVDKLYGATTTLGEAYQDGRCDVLTHASVTDTLLELAGKIENTRKNLSV